jgi:hypothetical protein
MPDSPPVPAPPVRRRRRWLLGGALALVVLVPVGLYLYVAIAAERTWRAAVEETERSDPRWRLTDVEADRAAVPREHNAAVLVLRARPLVPGRWPAWDIPAPGATPEQEADRAALEASFHDLPPQQQLSAAQLAALRAEMKKAAAAVAIARQLKDDPEGRYPITYSADWIGTLLPHAEKARTITQVLHWDALLQAQEGDADGALDSCRAILNAGRSIGDEPVLVSQLVRMALRAIAVNRVQRALAQGEPTDAALRQLQKLLEKEAPEPLLLTATRGERAGVDQFLDAIQTRKTQTTARDLLKLTGVGARNATEPPGLLENLALYSNAAVTSQRASLLRYMNRVVEIAKLPPEQQDQHFQELEETRKGQPLLVRVLTPALLKVADASRRTTAQLWCAVVALAAERYRRDCGRWPGGIGALVQAGYLRAVPADPYDGKPLRWRRLDDGVVVYSIGPHGKDHGGKMDFHNIMAEGTNLGFRLWDATRRRQPAPPPRPVPPAEELKDAERP